MAYAVTFRNNNETLTSMFSEKFKNVVDAKSAIETDAKWFVEAHKHYDGKKSRQKIGWVNPETEDYYQVKAQDGCSCVWQYFKI